MTFIVRHNTARANGIRESLYTAKNPLVSFAPPLPLEVSVLSAGEYSLSHANGDSFNCRAPLPPPPRKVRSVAMRARG